MSYYQKVFNNNKTKQKTDSYFIYLYFIKSVTYICIYICVYNFLIFDPLQEIAILLEFFKNYSLLFIIYHLFLSRVGGVMGMGEWLYHGQSASHIWRHTHTHPERTCELHFFIIIIS